MTRPKHGTSCSIRTRRPWLTASTPQVGQAASSCPDSTVEHQALLSSTSTSKTCMSGTSKIASARVHQRAPGPHVRWSTVGVFP